MEDKHGTSVILSDALVLALVIFTDKNWSGVRLSVCHLNKFQSCFLANWNRLLSRSVKMFKMKIFFDDTHCDCGKMEEVTLQQQVGEM